MAKLVSVVVDGFNIETSDFREKIKKESDALDSLLTISDNLPDGQITGGVVSFPVADGKAYYLVVRDKPLTLGLIPFGDRWQAHPALIRGLRREDIIDQLRARRKLLKTFGGKDGEYV